jgi:hypothetical protein
VPTAVASLPTGLGSFVPPAAVLSMTSPPTAHPEGPCPYPQVFPTRVVEN